MADLKVEAIVIDKDGSLSINGPAIVKIGGATITVDDGVEFIVKIVADKINIYTENTK